MGTKHRPDVATTGRMMKHITPSEDDEKAKINNYEVVPKLPSVKITQKSKQTPHLSDFLEDSNDGDSKGNIHLKPVGREKAFEILKQYNKLVSNETTLHVKNLPPLKLPLRKNPPPPLLPKHDATPRKVPIFTEGISSMSKTSNPSFIVPKDKVLRANLPNNIVVAHKKGNFSFGVKMPKQKSSQREVDESAKFKQMHNLGLDSLPIVNLEKYMKTKAKPSNDIKGIKPIVNGNRKQKPKKLEPLSSESNSNIKTSLEPSRSYDWTIDRKNAYRWNHQTSARSEGKAKVVWIGDNLSSEFAENKTRILKNIYPQIDIRSKPQEDQNRLKYPNRDPTVYGVCSLAPIDIIGQSKLHTGELSYRSDYRKFPKHQSRSNVNEYFYESESTSSSLNTDWKNMINNAITNRSSSAESSTITPRAVPNPPPSYVSSTHEDEEITIPLEASKTMHRIQEERSSLMMDSASNCIQQPFSAHSGEITASPKPAIVVINDESVANVELSKEEKSPRISRIGNVVNLKIDDRYLIVPPKFETEKRPPVKTDAAESSSQSHSSSDPVKGRLAIGGSENHKLNVTTLQLITSNERNSPLPPFNTFLSDAETTATGVVTRNVNMDQKHNGNDDTFKNLTINSKTLQFISPLQIQSNAKRQ